MIIEAGVGRAVAEDAAEVEVEVAVAWDLAEALGSTIATLDAGTTDAADIVDCACACCDCDSD
jgi:hypothetical protein